MVFFDACERRFGPAASWSSRLLTISGWLGTVSVDEEPGPEGQPRDTLFIHRFRRCNSADHLILADYVYASRSNGELLAEEHRLQCGRSGHALPVRPAMRVLSEVTIANVGSVSPFVLGRSSDL